MKKIITFLLALSLLALSACSSKQEEPEDSYADYYGIWQLSHVVKDGANYTVSELEALGNKDYSDMYLLVKEGGIAYLQSNSSDELQQLTYDQTEEGITINNVAYTINSDGELVMQQDEKNAIYFKKYSESQDITKIPEKKVEEVVVTEPEPEPEPTPAPQPAKTGISADFKATMDSYEAFFDEYVEFMKKYNSSSDTSSMMMEYLDFLGKYADYMEKLDQMDNGDLTAEEAAYYSEVNLRILQKLAEIQ